MLNIQDFSSDLLAGKTALVTGSARGIGLAIVHRLSEIGARVILADCDQIGVCAAARTLVQLGREALPLPVDVADAEATNRCAKALIRPWKDVDILVNNAGIFKRAALDADNSLETWDALRKVNSDGVVNMTAALSSVLARRKGSIVNVASVRALTACELAPAYSISKAVVVGLTRSYSRSLATFGIRVNAVAPGDIETDMSPCAAGSEAMRMLIARTALKRMGKPREVANLVAFLVSPLAASISGALLPVDGGFLVN
jgi:3-oxoacyl-[acyl-carrier protein] reductase